MGDFYKVTLNGDFDSVVEAAIGAAVAESIPAILSFIFSNIVGILLVLLALFLLAALIVLWLKRNIVKRWLDKARLRHREASAKLDGLILSETFKDLNNGFIQGSTRQSLERLEQAVLAARRQAEQLQARLSAQKVPFFSLVGPVRRIGRLNAEANALLSQSKRYEQELAGTERLAGDMRSSVGPVRQRAEELAALLDAVSAETGYPLGELRAALERTQAAIRQAEYSGSFDALKAQDDIRKAQREADALERKIAEFRKNADIFREIKRRTERQLERIAVERGQEANEVSIIVRQSGEIVRLLEESMQTGKAVDLRAAAAELEQLFKRAAADG